MPTPVETNDVVISLVEELLHHQTIPFHDISVHQTVDDNFGWSLWIKVRGCNSGCRVVKVQVLGPVDSSSSVQTHLELCQNGTVGSNIPWSTQQIINVDCCKELMLYSSSCVYR